MYDALTSRYTFSCPKQGESSVRLSAFRRVQRLPGASHPAVYRVLFACPCGEEHTGLVAHDDLDWAPLGLGEGTFLNVLTAHEDPLADEFADIAASKIRVGNWPWSFFCFREQRARPVYPSLFRLLAPAPPAGSVGIAVQCPACASVSVNVVSCAHVDLPFHNDREVGVVRRTFGAVLQKSTETFREELWGADVEPRRLAA